MTESQTRMGKALLVNLVTMFSMSAMQHLGKIINPLTGKAGVDLAAAQATIDMLDMLEAKTRGNLDADEQQLLKDTLKALKLNYVETAESQKTEIRTQPSAVSEKQDEGVEASGGDKATEGREDQGTKGQADQGTQGQREKKDPKFHKTYS